MYRGIFMATIKQIAEITNVSRGTIDRVLNNRGGVSPETEKKVRAAMEAREFDTLKSKKVPQSLEIGLFFCQIFIFII